LLHRLLPVNNNLTGPCLVHAWKHGRTTRGGGGGGGYTWLQLRSPAAPFSSHVVIGRGVARAVLASEVGLTKPADPVLPEVCYRSWQIGGRLLLWDSLVSMSAIFSWLFSWACFRVSRAGHAFSSRCIRLKDTCTKYTLVIASHWEARFRKIRFHPHTNEGS
jgi:hypothetical protein